MPARLGMRRRNESTFRRSGQAKRDIVLVVELTEGAGLGLRSRPHGHPERRGDVPGQVDRPGVGQRIGHPEPLAVEVPVARLAVGVQVDEFLAVVGHVGGGDLRPGRATKVAHLQRDALQVAVDGVDHHLQRLVFVAGHDNLVGVGEGTVEAVPGALVAVFPQPVRHAEAIRLGHGGNVQHQPGAVGLVGTGRRGNVDDHRIGKALVVLRDGLQGNAVIAGR
ncbi:hypothetical protein LCGC14_1441910 [marine sediment metagenome]|uniref:Uncharacterized protein n=1 Tax=marine sediment metagenome TaxID=412755 RepID=A0A0F9JKF9_9ZZZZ